MTSTHPMAVAVNDNNLWKLPRRGIWRKGRLSRTSYNAHFDIGWGSRDQRQRNKDWVFTAMGCILDKQDNERYPVRDGI